MKKPIYILGISESHTATAALLKNGEIIACASEERFTRKKLQAGIPNQAIKFCLDFAKIRQSDLSLVAVADKVPPIFIKKQVNKVPQNYSQALSFLFDLEETIERAIPSSRPLFFSLYKKFRSLNIPALQENRLRALQKTISVSKEKFVFTAHHTCHASAALFSSSLASKKEPTLIFTADGVGDFESATIHKYENNRLKKLVSIDSQQSLGFFYLHITQFLGLKPIEDEYKVMGLAPYANPTKARKTYELLKPYFKIEKSQKRWQIKVSEIHIARNLNKILSYERFDYIAYAAQKILEEILTQWIENIASHYKIKNAVFGGGVFANIKANQKIAEVSGLKNIFFMPSPGDESNAIGAAYQAYFDLIEKPPQPLKSLYLGPAFADIQIKKSLPKLKGKFKVNSAKNINSHVAKLLAQGEVVARFSGRMEFGARALGNRSILASPKDKSVVDFINSAIKNRDFWMPFAPTILRQRAEDYLIPNHADSPFMNVAYNTTETGKKDLAACIHPYDKTTRPQILDKSINPDYWDLIKKFEKLTGIGAVLNTSFNLHGEPIVCTPQDALNTFVKSGLKYLAIGEFLISKVYS